MSDAAHGFPPLEAPGARVLVLGSMPGRRSLAEQRYYAHPQNAFWRIMAAIAGFDAESPYEARVEALTSAGVAVWDVLRFCERPGSLDADIRPETRVINDFSGFMVRQPGLRLVCCNGGTAAQAWRRQVLPTLTGDRASVDMQQLPSTSAAHASLRLEEKLARWRVVMAPILERA